MAIGIDPTVDFAFQRLLGSQETSEITVHFLNAVTLELPKYNPGCIDGADASPLDEWIWFLNNAAELTLDEIVRRLKSPIFVKAAGVLDMISQSPLDRYLYELSLKPARDEAARLEFARLEGEARGKVIGLIGQLHLLQDLLGQPKTPASALEQTDHVTLQTLVANLQQQLRARI